LKFLATPFLKQKPPLTSSQPAPDIVHLYCRWQTRRIFSSVNYRPACGLWLYKTQVGVEDDVFQEVHARRPLQINGS